MTSRTSFRFTPRVTPLARSAFTDAAGAVDVGLLLARLASRHEPVALDAPAGEPDRGSPGRPGRGSPGRPGRWSIVAFDPLAGAPPPRDLAGLRAFVARLAAHAGDAVPGPFQGGFVGALAYDLGVAGERQALPAAAWPVPPIVGGLYVDFVAVDVERGAAWLVLGDDPGDGRPDTAARRAELLALLAHEPELAPYAPSGPLVRCVPAAEHVRRVEAARASIAAGDFYQVNLAHRFTRRVRGAPVELYRRLARVNPAPYMAFLAHGGDGRTPALALCSASPELLLEVDGASGRRSARTRPIKGTAARSDDPREDERAAQRLLASAKDLAELAMIVDLERNDLGRVARTGGVRVEAFPRRESYAGVHHLVADVAAELCADADALDALAALFPGGSISGAPKLASMAAIAALEREGRGFFSGSLGWLDVRGHARFNVLIRTLTWRADPAAGPDAAEVGYHVGGGITWSSDAADEERETLLKGARLALALDGDAAAGSTAGGSTADGSTADGSGARASASAGGA